MIVVATQFRFRLSPVPPAMSHTIAVTLLDPPRTNMALHCDADMVRAIAGARQVKFLLGPARSRAKTRSPRLGALGLWAADLVAAAFGGRPRPRPAAGAFVSAAAADVGLLEGGVLLTRVTTRSAVTRSVNRVTTVARSVSRRASRSLTFVFSALI